MKRFLAALLAAMLAFSFSAMAEGPSYTVGICQLVQHDALDDATLGFKAALTELLGSRISFIEQNASGDTATCISIANSFIAEEVDLILANATQALQAVYASTGDIPVLGVSVSDYAAALDMDQWTGVTGVNVSGTSDLAPIADQAELIRELFPAAKNIGLLYCSSEANSEYQAAIMQGHLTAMGYSCKAYTFTDSNDVFAVTQNACAGSDVIYVPTDNVVASCSEVIRNVIDVEKTPIIGGDEGICSVCGVATLGMNYYSLGYATGKMAYRILVQGADPATMPIQFVSNFTKKYNAELCQYLGISVPGDFEALD
ncbi:MAG: ABC transporter substrate-binding protein [Clostridia bacterium]|nr:ABC transporter substrate-binding protein [Clostridia bacterium]